MASLRLWPALLIAGLAVSRIAWFWLRSEGIRQDRVLGTLGTTLLAALLLLVWLLLFSRLPRRVRLAALGGALAILGMASALLRVRGVTGDVMPILGWRWSNRPTEQARAVPRPPALPLPIPEANGFGARPAAPATLQDRDYPQFLGPRRNATLRGLRLNRDWTTHPPKRLWREAVGAGWSAFAVAGELALTQEQRGGEEQVVAYELHTGRLVWRHADDARYDTVVAGEGPRATPTIAGDRVYTLGATGILNALDLATGGVVWTRNILVDNGALAPTWGKSCSPLVLGGRVIVSAGGAGGRSLVAYDTQRGDPVWAGGADASGYSSPFLAELGGVAQVLIFNEATVAAHDPDTGAQLWQRSWPAEQPNVAQPLPLPGDRLLVSAGYGIGSKLFQVARGEDGRWTTALLWESPRLKAKFTNLVFHGGYVYGLDDGVLVCLDPTNGERRWRAGRYGHGQVILIDDILLVQAEDGEVVLVQPNPARLTELTRFAALDGKTWNPPALAGSLLLVRNDREAAAYELPLEGGD